MADSQNDGAHAQATSSQAKTLATNSNSKGKGNDQKNKNKTTHGKDSPGRTAKNLEMVSSVQLAELDEAYGDPAVAVAIKNYMFLASYNRVDISEPTILVPGKPARWAPPLPVTAPKDNQQKKREDSKDRIVAPRWAACFAALLFMQPSYTLLPGSIVADRNSIRKLLDFVSGKRSQYDWQIDAQMMKGTIFLTRWENDPSQHVIDRFYDGYGKSFEKAFLEHGVGLEDSSSHHRIVSYELGGMRWILQFEADGYLVDNDADYGFATDQGTDVSVVALPLSKRVDAVSLNSNQQYEMLEGVKVIRRGSLVSPDSIIEARTRKNGSKSPSGDESTSILVLQDESHV